MTDMTQQQRIIEKLEEDGQVSNIWCVDNFILRGSERIRELQKAGWVFSKERGRRGKFTYFLVQKPITTKTEVKPLTSDHRAVQGQLIPDSSWAYN